MAEREGVRSGTLTNFIHIPINPSGSNVFFRLIYP